MVGLDWVHQGGDHIARHGRVDSISQRADGLMRLRGRLVVLGEAHGRAVSGSGQHAHAAAVDQCPARPCCHRADWAVQASIGGAGAAAVMGRQEAVAVGCLAGGDARQGCAGSAGLVGRAPAPRAEVQKGAGRYVLALRQVQHRRRAASVGSDEHAYAVLGRTVVGCIHDARCQGVAKLLRCQHPGWERILFQRLGHVLDHSALWPQACSGADNRPGGAAARIVLWVAFGLSACFAVALAAEAASSMSVGGTRLQSAWWVGSGWLTAWYCTASGQWLAAQITRAPAMVEPVLQPPAPAKRPIAFMGPQKRHSPARWRGWWCGSKRSQRTGWLMRGGVVGSWASFCEQSPQTWHAWKRREPEAGFFLLHWMQSMVLARS